MSVFLRKYNTLLVTGTTAIKIPIIKRAVVDFAVSADWTPAAGDVKVWVDGTAANITNLPTAINSGNCTHWEFILTAAELSGKNIIVTVTDSATKAVEDQHFIVETFGHASAMYPTDLSVASTAQTGDSYAIVNSGTHGNAALKTLIDALPVSTRNAVTGGAYALSTDANGRIRIVDGTAAGELDTSSGKVFLSGTQTFDNTGTWTGNITGNLSGSVGSVTGLTASDVGAIKTKTDFLPSATAGAAGGLFIAGSNAATTINALAVTNATTLSGAVSLGSTLTVTGLTQLQGLRASAAVIFQDTWTVTGTTSLAGVTISGTLVGNDVELGNVDFSGNFIIDGTATVTGAVTATNASNDIRGVLLSTAGNTAIRNAVTGGAYALDTDANGRIRIVDGTAAGELDTNAGKVLLAAIQAFDNTGSWTGDITGNLSGSVGSVSGAVGSVTGAVGSVTGAVGSVTGNVGGNVTGSVGSIASGGIAAASIATAAAEKLADVTLRRTPTNIEASSFGDTLALGSLYGLIQQAQKSDTTTHAGKLTVFKVNGVTELGQLTITTDAAAEPITSAL